MIVFNERTADDGISTHGCEFAEKLETVVTYSVLIPVMSEGYTMIINRVSGA
jgi:hypothetical protein